jgi:hypothetical protein
MKMKHEIRPGLQNLWNAEAKFLKSMSGITHTNRMRNRQNWSEVCIPINYEICCMNNLKPQAIKSIFPFIFLQHFTNYSITFHMPDKDFILTKKKSYVCFWGLCRCIPSVNTLRCHTMTNTTTVSFFTLTLQILFLVSLVCNSISTIYEGRPQNKVLNEFSQ